MAVDLAASITATEDDRLLQAEALVRAHCGWHIAPTRTETVTVRGTGARTLVLPSLKVVDVASVSDDATVLTETQDYKWSEAGVLTREGYWSTDDVEVTFTHGYAEPPAEVTAIVQAVAQRAVNNPGSLVRTQAGPFADTYSQTGFNQSLPIALLEAEREALAHYRMVSVS